MVDAVTVGDLSAANDAFDTLVAAKREHEWVRKNVLKQTQQDIDEIDKQIEAEKAAEIIDPEAGTNMGGPDGGFGAMPDGEFEQEPQGAPGQGAAVPDADAGRKFGGPENQNL